MVVLLKGNGSNKNFSLHSALGAESVYDFRERRDKDLFVCLFFQSLATLGKDVAWQPCSRMLISESARG